MEAIEHMMSNLELDDVKCNVCFHVNREPFIFVRCGHTICAGCGGRWLASCTYCPMCRTQVKEVEIHYEMKAKAEEYLRRHPEQESQHDIRYEQNMHEMVFWSIQQRKQPGDEDVVFFGPQPIMPPHFCPAEAADYYESVRIHNIRQRLDVLRDRIGEQTTLVQQQYREEMFNRMFYQNEVSYRDEDHEWQMIHGRGLVRVPREFDQPKLLSTPLPSVPQQLNYSALT
ncbi:unnamed protein product [Caenorhabditis nigoni]